MTQEQPSDHPAAVSAAVAAGGEVSPAAPTGAAAGQGAAEGREPLPAVSDAELARLHVRVVALEALVAALLVDASAGQLARVRAMAAYIMPRPGSSPHPLTERAAEQMEALLDRARRFGDVGSGEQAPAAGTEAS